METQMKQEFTEQQALMVLEYFVQQAAAAMPVITDWKVWDKALWIGRMKASVAIERQITEQDWDDLLNAQLDLQTFDRDPDGWQAEHEWSGYASTREYLETQLNWLLNVAFLNSGA